MTTEVVIHLLLIAPLSPIGRSGGGEGLSIHSVTHLLMLSRVVICDLMRGTPAIPEHQYQLIGYRINR